MKPESNVSEKKINLFAHVGFIWICYNWGESSIIVKKNNNLFPICIVHYFTEHVQRRRMEKLQIQVYKRQYSQITITNRNHNSNL